MEKTIEAIFFGGGGRGGGGGGGGGWCGGWVETKMETAVCVCIGDVLELL